MTKASGSDHRWLVHSFHLAGRLLRSAIVLKLSTLLYFHYLLNRRKYRMLFSSKRRHRPGPKGPYKELINAVVVMKRRNPNGVVPALPSRSRCLSASRSIRMWSVVS